MWSTRRYLFGRLWTSEDVFGDVVYWTRHFKKGQDKPIAWLAMESGKFVTVKEHHQKVVERLFELIKANDEKINPMQI